jgi:hypothetical protein
MFRKAAAGSAKNITPMREVARLKAAGSNSNTCASPSNVTFCKPPLADPLPRNLEHRLGDVDRDDAATLADGPPCRAWRAAPRSRPGQRSPSATAIGDRAGGRRHRSGHCHSLPDRLVRHRDAAGGQHLLDHAQAQREKKYSQTA